jgi:hypothetical protein
MDRLQPQPHGEAAAKEHVSHVPVLPGIELGNARDRHGAHLGLRLYGGRQLPALRVGVPFVIRGRRRRLIVDDEAGRDVDALRQMVVMPHDKRVTFWRVHFDRFIRQANRVPDEFPVLKTVNRPCLIHRLITSTLSSML